LIERTSDALLSRRITIRKGKSWIKTNWLSFAKYEHGGGFVELRFDKVLKPYLLQVKNRYKSYPIESIIYFRSGYSIRIFELLKAEEFKSDTDGFFRRSFEYAEFREMLGIDESEYTLFADFRRYIIETATREINTNPDVQILRMEYLKTGRKVSHIVFHCGKRRQLQLDMNEPLPTIQEVEGRGKQLHPEYISELVAIGIEEETAYRWKKKYGATRLRNAIAYTKAMQKANKIRDSLSGFVARAVQDNIGQSWVEQRKKEEEERKARAKEEAEQMRQEEEQERKRREQRERQFDAFQSLPDGEKAEFRKSFEAKLNEIELRTWRKAKDIHPDAPEKYTAIKVKFLTEFALFSIKQLAE